MLVIYVAPKILISRRTKNRRKSIASCSWSNEKSTISNIAIFQKKLATKFHNSWCIVRYNLFHLSNSASKDSIAKYEPIPWKIDNSLSSTAQVLEEIMIHNNWTTLHSCVRSPIGNLWKSSISLSWILHGQCVLIKSFHRNTILNNHW